MKTWRAAVSVVVMMSAGAAFAVGSDDTEPPAPTPTSTDCPEGQVWDEETKACLEADAKGLTDEDRYRALRELAYAGRYDAARIVLEAMPPESDAVWTYRGFIARQEGHWLEALANYRHALGLNPDNILARSYLGQGLALRGETAAAERQLAEIRARGGSGTWAEAALVEALTTGKSYNY